MTWDNTYPRPQLRRDSFFPLNSGWTLNGSPIRIPWPPEASLSGYRGELGTDLRYETTFSLPDGFLPTGHRLWLHFGAVDQIAEVTLNGKAVIRHEGGYLPFSANITAALREGGNILTVRAIDTISPIYPYGKQRKDPSGIWYTPVSGIWQTVWLEAVPDRCAVSALKITPDLCGLLLEVESDATEYTISIPQAGLTLSCREKRVRIDLPEPHLWTPNDPYLYDLAVETETDKVESYFALRTVSTREIGGHIRLCLNDEPIFLHGVLDQGYFMDGLYLPAEPEEYERDILRMKELGYNTLRKHLKIEPESFYYACDRLGMLVLQDMVNSGRYNVLLDTYYPVLVSKKRPDIFHLNSRRRRKFFEQHVRDTQDHLYNHPCIVGYTIFNEGWGQFASNRIYRACKQKDPTRFYDSTSGWFAQKESDVESEHIYMRHIVMQPARPDKLLLLSECGGFIRQVEGHIQREKKSHGYGVVETEETMVASVQAMYSEMVLPSIPNGLCGSIYTQLSDVEGETNGLYTYDRQVRKLQPAPMLKIRADIEAAMTAATGRQTERTTVE